MSDIDQPEGPISGQAHMDPDHVRGPDEEELEWPEPQDDGGDDEDHGEPWLHGKVTDKIQDRLARYREHVEREG